MALRILSQPLDTLEDDELAARFQGGDEDAVKVLLERYRRFWDESLDRLDDYLADLQKGNPDGRDH